MLRRTMTVLAMAIVAMVIPSGPAVGGGMSWFDFDRDYYVPGDHAVGETGFWTSEKDRHLLDRTWHAYLIPGHGWIEPPRIPDAAVPIGTVTLSGLARVSFIVPDVEPGGYTVGICDRPCRHSYVGDLGGGWISVVESRQEARLRGMIDRLERRLDGVRGQLRKQGERADRRANLLREEIGDLREATGKWERRQAWLETRLAQLEREPTGLTFDRAGWAVAALAIAALAASIWRRRRSSAPVPALPATGTTSPDDDRAWQLDAAVLEEEEERQPAGVG
jgi:hypothetical protein